MTIQARVWAIYGVTPLELRTKKCVELLNVSNMIKYALLGFRNVFINGGGTYMVKRVQEKVRFIGYLTIVLYDTWSPGCRKNNIVLATWQLSRMHGHPDAGKTTLRSLLDNCPAYMVTRMQEKQHCVRYLTIVLHTWSSGCSKNNFMLVT